VSIRSVIRYLWFMENKFDVRNTEEADYVELVDWWKWHKFTPPVRIMLPDDFSSGLMVSKDGENICAGFIYTTSASKLFKVEFIVSTYKVKDRQIRDEALKFLITGLIYMCKQMGAKLIYTNIWEGKKNLIESLNECGFLYGSKNCQEMIYVDNQ